ncbi:MAG: inositol monophosphatase [Candidatus Uhrbacteria bacterium]
MPIDMPQLESIVRRVRAIVMPFYGNVAFTDKGAYRTDHVTELDVRVEEFLRDELSTAFPGIPFVGEETGGDRSAARHWLCDPIDGTAHYIRGLPFCTTMLALIEDGKVTTSVIYDFVGDVFYHAIRGQGAFRDGEPIHVSDRTLNHSYLGWETRILKPENLQMHMALSAESSFFKTMNAGYEFTLVATGKIEGRLCFDPWGKDYDFAPGSLLVQEAGGIVANIGSREYDYKNLNFLATNPRVFKELTEGEGALFPIL